jgi:hypothetical protein
VKPDEIKTAIMDGWLADKFLAPVGVAGQVMFDQADVTVQLPYEQTFSLEEILWLQKLLQPESVQCGANNDFDFGYVYVRLVGCKSLT